MDRPDLEAINEWNRGREGPESWIRRDAQDAAQYAFALERELQTAQAANLEIFRRAEGLDGLLDSTQRQRDKAEVERDTALARLRELEEALRFYAQQRGLGARLASDGGAIARAALSGRGEQDSEPGNVRPKSNRATNVQEDDGTDGTTVPVRQRGTAVPSSPGSGYSEEDNGEISREGLPLREPEE